MTATFPVVVPDATLAVSSESLTNVNVAGVPLKETAVVPVKPPPLIETAVPVFPAFGVKLVTVGTVASTVNALDELVEPAAFVTSIGPVELPTATVAVSCVSLCTVKAAGVPLNATAVVVARLVPVTVTDESGESPIACEMLWAWVPRRR